MNLNGYLSLTDTSSGRCVEIFNAARTLSHLRNGRASKEWRETESGGVWDGFECWTFDESNYEDGSNPDPWFDPRNPATAEAAGFLPDAPGRGLGFVLEPTMASRLVGAAGIQPMEMVVTGTVVASTERGEQAYLDWLSRVLGNGCADAHGWEATVFSHCPCPDLFEPFLVVGGPPAFPIVDPGAPAPFGDICDPAPPVLEPWTGDLPEILDDGSRTLIRVRFVGLDELGDAGTFPGRTGRRWALRFTVSHPTWYTRPEPFATVGGEGAFELCDSLDEPFRRCPPPPTDPVVCGPDVGTQRRRAISRRTRWITPRCFMRSSALTAPQAPGSVSRLRVVVSNGTGDVRNARLRLWRAIDGIPDPATDAGNRVYRQIEPEWEARIPLLRRHETITLDGRGPRVTLDCSNGTQQTGSGLAESRDGSSWAPSPLYCDGRYWVVLDVSSHPDARGGLDLAATVEIFREEVPA